MSIHLWNGARRLGPLAPALILFAWVAFGGRSVAAPPPQLAAPICFPETGYCTGGRIREVWERGGGLMVFGFPITSLQEELVEGRPIKVQWFERARLELHPDQPYPYDVLVGRVGAELLQQDPDLRALAATTIPGECRSFTETGQQVCGDFLVAWRSAGLDLDGDPALSNAESMALYGLPLTPARTERLDDGQTFVVQWFERARFELHAQAQGPGVVLRGLLGRQLTPVAVDPPGTPWIEPGGPPLATPPPYQPSPPAPGPPPPAVASGGPLAPARLVIDAIGLDRRTVPVGLDEAGVFIVPDHEIGWYMGSAAPGQGENIVLWGHVLPFLSAPHLPAPFARMQELAPGVRVTLIDTAGQTHAYVVTQQIRVTPDQVGYVLEQGRELVTMVSCIGEGIYSGGGIVDYTERLITIAEPVAVGS